MAMIDAAPRLAPDANYTAAEVADWLRHPVEWFYRHRTRLERDKGFPQPIPSTGQPRWRGRILNAWAETPPDTKTKAARRPPGGADVLDLRTEAVLLEVRRRSGAASTA
jgi:hypothetical protein